MMRKGWIILVLTLGILFLYAPIATLIIYSFNASRLVNVWGGWSLHWYHVLFQDGQIGAALWLSLRVAITAASGGLVLGTLLAVILTRYGWFRGRLFIYGMAITPLVMPDVVTGLSLLVLFVSVGHFLGFSQGFLGFGTIVLAHMTFCAAYAAIVIRARLQSLNPVFEEAALDLGARPTKTFFVITLPQISGALLAAWLMAFTLSIDDLVITSFVSGAKLNTLPMYIFSTVKTGVTPEVNALATLMIGTVATLVLLGYGVAVRYGRR